MEWADKNQIQAARHVDLYDFLLYHHPGDVKREGDSLRLKANHSVSVKRGYNGYKDFSTGETGNSLTFLTTYLGYSLPEAVAALLGQSVTVPAQPAPPATATAPRASPAFELPEPMSGQYRQLFAYLTQTRRIPAPVIQQLITDRIMYQASERGNIVFVNPDRTFAELRGTNTSKPFHRVMFSDAAAFWWVKSHGLYADPKTAYVCESAIDAISLYCLHQLHDQPPNALYCSIGGVTNQQRIDAIRAGMSADRQTVIAVDNDPAGEKCRQRNPDCRAIVPKLKDWNADWIAHLDKERG